MLPVLDLGIQKGMQRAYALRRMPKPAEMMVTMAARREPGSASAVKLAQPSLAG